MVARPDPILPLFNIGPGQKGKGNQAKEVPVALAPGRCRLWRQLSLGHLERHRSVIMNVNSAAEHEPCDCKDEGRPAQFCVNTEGILHFVSQSCISAEEIARLGAWDPTQGVIEVLADNSERTLAAGEVVQLRAGIAFCRRVRWKRGLTRGERIGAEMALLQQAFPGVEHRESWVRIPGVKLPPGWTPDVVDVAFQISDVFPGAPPYGIFVPVGIRFNGQMPQNYSEPAGSQPPFGGVWGIFSWSVADGADWRPTASVEHGVNLLQWARSFAKRFAEGA
jgi:hypothetical protein